MACAPNCSEFLTDAAEILAPSLAATYRTCSDLRGYPGRGRAVSGSVVFALCWGQE